MTSTNHPLTQNSQQQNGADHRIRSLTLKENDLILGVMNAKAENYQYAQKNAGYNGIDQKNGQLLNSDT